MLTVLAFIFLFLLITLSHELGHLVMAKRAGIRVYEFALGFGPKLFGITKAKTEYSLRAIPLGGFVRIAGMGVDKEDATCPAAEQYQNKSPWKKFSALVAGPIMNLILAVLIFTAVFSLHGAVTGISNEVARVLPGSEAARIGIQPGDRILAINNQKIENMEAAIELIHQSSGKPLILALERDKKSLAVTAVPRYDEKAKKGLIGFAPKALYQRLNPLRALVAAFTQTFALVALILYFLGKLLMGGLPWAEIAGPVGIAQISGQYAAQGLVTFAQFVAFFSINVAVLNLLPLPALDGGRLCFVLLEALRKKAVPIDTENRIHHVGLMLLLCLAAVITVNDLVRLFSAR